MQQPNLLLTLPAALNGIAALPVSCDDTAVSPFKDEIHTKASQADGSAAEVADCNKFADLERKLSSRLPPPTNPTTLHFDFQPLTFDFLGKCPPL